MPEITVAVVDGEILAAIIAVLEGRQFPRLADADLAARLRAAIIQVASK